MLFTLYLIPSLCGDLYVFHFLAGVGGALLAGKNTLYRYKTINIEKQYKSTIYLGVNVDKIDEKYHYFILLCKFKMNRL